MLRELRVAELPAALGKRPRGARDTVHHRWIAIQHSAVVCGFVR